MHRSPRTHKCDLESMKASLRGKISTYLKNSVCVIDTYSNPEIHGYWKLAQHAFQCLVMSKDDVRLFIQTFNIS